MILACTSAAADYVRYFKVTGGWAVTCWWDRVTDKENCSLESPPPSGDPGPGHSVVRIMETPADGLTVTIEIRGIADPRRPIHLEVDGTALPAAALDPAYMARWQGRQADALIAHWLKAGRAVLIWRDRNGGKKKKNINLQGLREALGDFRSNLRRRGVLGKF
ncbi:MAG: hypothetical protein RIB59_09225 [Rhodospirillales bacterium]